MTAHSVCLAGEFLKGTPEAVLPVEGKCPVCRKQVLWGDLIRRFNGALDLVEAADDDEDDGSLGDDLDLSDVGSADDDDE